MSLKKRWKYPTPLEIVRQKSQKQIKTLGPQSVWKAQELIDQGWEFMGGEFSPKGRTLRLVFVR